MVKNWTRSRDTARHCYQYGHKTQEMKTTIRTHQDLIKLIESEPRLTASQCIDIAEAYLPETARIITFMTYNGTDNSMEDFYRRNQELVKTKLIEWLREEGYKMDTRPDLWPKPLMLYRSEEHTSELQSLMRISYAVFCLKKKKKNNNSTQKNTNYYNHII